MAGHYWAALGIGSYAEGMGALRALANGIEGKFRRPLERATALDERYDHGSIPVVWAAYYLELPWPKRDRDKAAEQLKRALAINPANLRARLYQARIDKRPGPPRGGEGAAGRNRGGAGRALRRARGAAREEGSRRDGGRPALTGRAAPIAYLGGGPGGMPGGAPIGEKCSWTIFQSPLYFTNTIVVASFSVIGFPCILAEKSPSKVAMAVSP